MKAKELIGLFLLSLATIFAGGCSDDENKPLSFYDDSYEVPVHGTRYIGVESGSGDYTLQVENWGIFSALVDDGWSNPAGMLLIRGLLTGEATLTVTDNQTRETRTLHIKVTNNYEVFRVSAYENNHPVLSKAPFLFLVNNQARDVYFVDREEISLTDYRLRVLGKGTYTFTIKDNEPSLTLIYAADNDGQLTDDPTIASEPHTFRITRSSEFALHRLDENLNLGWETPSGSYPDEQRSLSMEMEEVATCSKIEGSLEEVEIPRGILN